MTLDKRNKNLGETLLGLIPLRFRKLNNFIIAYFVGVVLFATLLFISDSVFRNDDIGHWAILFILMIQYVLGFIIHKYFWVWPLGVFLGYSVYFLETLFGGQNKSGGGDLPGILFLLILPFVMTIYSFLLSFGGFISKTIVNNIHNYLNRKIDTNS